ncbi:MAG: DNA polymerase III subunit delta [Prevotella sp.]
MPQKKAVATFDAIMRDLKSGAFSPLYLLMGEESYYIDQISDYIQAHALTSEQQAFDQTVVFGADVNAAQIADLAMQYPMMSSRKVIIVKEAQDLHSFERLERYAEKPQEKTILVICYKNGVLKGKSKLLSAVERNGILFESKKLRDWQLAGYVRAYLAKQKIDIDDKSASMIADHIGADLNRLTSELDKLGIALPEDDRRVTPEVVEKNIGVSKDFNAFELRSAIVNRDIFKANQIIKYFDNNPKAGTLYALLPLLFNYFQNLMLTYYAPDRNNQQALADFLELRNVWGVKDYMAGARNYSGKKVLQVLEKIRETDAKSKGLDNPNTSPGDLMKELIFFILH